jgi:5-methylthioadenosine/S-adenosylhomocysteine deaminase
MAPEFLKARWVLPMDGGEPIENAVVELSGKHIKAVHRLPSGETGGAYSQALSDYGDAILLPGLINLHTHLDYSCLRAVDGEGGLFAWIPRLMAVANGLSACQYRQSALSGAREALSFGTSTVVDASYTGQAAWAAAKAGLRALVGLELFGVDENSAEAAWRRWLDRYESWQEDENGDQTLKDAVKDGLVKLTVAPHAPYTVCPRLMKMAINWADERGLPVLFHLSETVEEVEWVRDGNSKIDEFLLSRPGFVPNGLTDLNWRGQRLSPVEHLKRHQLFSKNFIAAHCVHVSEADVDELVAYGAHVAHCPRSNARLGSGAASLDRFERGGLNYGFGTDSCASTDNLDILAEARYAWLQRRAFKPSAVADGGFASAGEAMLRLTAKAAPASGWGDEIGTIKPGKLADVAVFKIAESHCGAVDKPYDLLLWGGAHPVDLYVNGRKVVDSRR